MIKLKNNFYSIFLFIYISGFGQDFNYDLDHDGKSDNVTLDLENYIVKIKFNDSNSLFEIPEIIGYEKVKMIKFRNDYINIHYSSSSVSSIDLFVKNINKKWILTSTLFYSPCQTCENKEVKTCENKLNLEIEKLNEDNVESMVFNQTNCRKFYQNSIMRLTDLYLYANRILMKDYCLNEKMITKIIDSQPVTSNNILEYKKIKILFSKVKISAPILDKKIAFFENKILSKKKKIK
jgi:hypothetical protein